MNKLKSNQIGPWCNYCAPLKIRAVYREDGFRGLFSCESHKEKLLSAEARDREMDSRVTMADEMTWMNL
jgi:hypothetical protein